MRSYRLIAILILLSRPLVIDAGPRKSAKKKKHSEVVGFTSRRRRKSYETGCWLIWIWKLAQSEQNRKGKPQINFYLECRVPRL